MKWTVLLIIICILGSGPIDELKLTPVLQKTHYSWPVVDQQLTAINPELTEVFRICKSVPVGDTNSDVAIMMAGDLARKLVVDIAVNCSPWPMSRCPQAKADLGDPVLYAEIVTIGKRFQTMKRLLGTAKIGVILYDDERWFDQADVMLSYRQALYNTAKFVFPEAKILFYGFGAIQPTANTNGWSNGYGRFNLKEYSDCRSVSLYCVPQLYRTQQSYTKTVQFCDLLGNKNVPVIPWVALNCGYEPQAGVMHVWRESWDYGLQYACLLGAQINEPWYSSPENIERYAPWNRATFVVLYPNCPSGGPLLTRTPKWLQYFLAYCRGAQGRYDISGLDTIP